MHPNTIKRLQEMDKARSRTNGMEEFFKMMKEMAPKDREKPKTCSGCGREGETDSNESL